MPIEYYKPFKFARSIREIKKVVALYEGDYQEYCDFRSDDQAKLSVLDRKLSEALGHVAIHHFGLGGKIPPVDWVEPAMKHVNLVLSNDLVKIKRASRGFFLWVECFERFLILSCVSRQRKEMRTVFANFLRENYEVEKTPDNTDPCKGKLILLIASNWRDRPFDAAKLEKEASKSRKKRTKALLRAWLSLQNDDRSGFCEAIIEGVAEYAAKETPSSSALVTVAAFESGLVGLAYEKGWRDLEFPFDTACRLVTHKSLGLDK